MQIAMTKRNNRINCLDRALDILEAIVQARDGGVSELARRLNLHVATTYNLIKTLTLRHYLMNVNGRYRIGPAVESLSASWDPRMPLNQLLDPFVQELNCSTGERSVATVLFGFQAKFIISYEDNREASANFVQTICNPLSIATGRVLVAFGPEALWKQFVIRYQKSGEVQADDRMKDNDAWTQEFQKIRKNFFAQIRKPAISAFAAPVLNKNNVIVASLGVVCPNMRVTGKYIALMKKKTTREADKASRLFGGKYKEGCET